MKKRRLSRDILILVILSLITDFTWIGLDLYRIFFKEEEVFVPPQQMEPLNPEIDQEIINQISQESSFGKGEYLPPENMGGEEATSGAEGSE
jgi:hypothetical protein